MPTRSPFFIAATASSVATKLLPTPPLPLATAITFFTCEAAFSFAEKSNASFRSPQLLPQLEQSCVQSSAMPLVLSLRADRVPAEAVREPAARR